MLGGRVPRPLLRGQLGAHTQNHPWLGKKKKNPKQYFGSPNYELPSSLIENYYGDRPDFTPPSDLSGAYLAPADKDRIVPPGTPFLNPD